MLRSGLVLSLLCVIGASAPALAEPLPGDVVAPGKPVRIAASDKSSALVRRLAGLTCVADELGLKRSPKGGWNGRVVCGASDWLYARPRPSTTGATAIARVDLSQTPLETPDDPAPPAPALVRQPWGEAWEVVPVGDKATLTFEVVRLVVTAGDPIALRLDGLIASTETPLTRTGDTFAGGLGVDGGTINIAGVAIERLRVPGASTKIKKVPDGKPVALLDYVAFFDAPTPRIPRGTTCVTEGGIVGPGSGWLDGVVVCGEQAVTGRVAIGDGGVK